MLIRRHGRPIAILLFTIFMTCVVGWRRPAPTAFVVLRGGDITEEDAALDAYIEELIASVETTDGEEEEQKVVVKEEEKDDSRSNNDEEEAEEIKLHHEDDEERSLLETSPSEIETTKPERKHKPKRKVSKKKGSPKASKKKKSVSKRKQKQKKSVKVDEQLESEEAVEKTEETLKENVTAVQPKEKVKEETPVQDEGEEVTADNSTTTTRAKTDKDQKSEPSYVTTSRQRQRPPSPLERLLLRQGLVGKVCAMMLFLVSEWIDTYVPPLAHLLALVTSRLWPQQQQYRRSRGPRPERKTSTGLSSTAVSSRRTGQTGRQRRKLTMQADQAALEQLKRVGNVKEAKYRYVSEDFLVRHGLGRYAKDMEDAEPLVREEKPVKKVQVVVKREESEDEDDDDDWVFKALTEDKPDLEKVVGDAVSPRYAIEGEAEDNLRRSSVAKAATRKHRKKKKPSSGPRASDKDGGDGIFGRIRAAAGVNSLVSRSLLGAYPGDAAPPDEAGSAGGLMDLARKYGWGDWSDDEAEAEIDWRVAPQKTRKRKKRTRVARSPAGRQSSSKVSIEISLGTGRTKGRTKKRRKKSSSRRSSTAEEPPLTDQSPQESPSEGKEERTPSSGPPLSVRAPMGTSSEQREKSNLTLDAGLGSRGWTKGRTKKRRRRSSPSLLSTADELPSTVPSPTETPSEPREMSTLASDSRREGPDSTKGRTKKRHRRPSSSLSQTADEPPMTVPALAEPSSEPREMNALVSDTRRGGPDGTKVLAKKRRRRSASPSSTINDPPSTVRGPKGSSSETKEGITPASDTRQEIELLRKKSEVVAPLERISEVKRRKKKKKKTRKKRSPSKENPSL